MHFILIGNPGVGKSTILNGFVGEANFESGPSFGGGKTKLTNTQQYKGNFFTDTPGLADVSLRKQAAEEISKGLKKGGKFKIIFVLQPNEGRTRPDDITTMKLVLDSAPIEEYGIILNKLEDEVYDMMENNVEGAMDHTLASFGQLKPHPLTAYIHLMKRQSRIAGKKNQVPTIDRDLQAFINSIPPIEIPSDKVKDIEFDQYEKMFNALENTLQTLRDDKKALEEQMRKDKKEWEEKLMQMQRRNAEMERKMNESSPSDKVGDMVVAAGDAAGWIFPGAGLATRGVNAVAKALRLW